MQTKLERLQKQILLNTEITAIMKQSNRLMDIVKENQEEVNELKAECDRLDEKALGLVI
jgi:gas vesicle protein